MKHAICYVTFTPGGKYYSYFTGGLEPRVGDMVIVKVGEHFKIVQVELLGQKDAKATQTIYGLVTPQPKEQK